MSEGHRDSSFDSREEEQCFINVGCPIRVSYPEEETGEDGETLYLLFYFRFQGCTFFGFSGAGLCSLSSLQQKSTFFRSEIVCVVWLCVVCVFDELFYIEQVEVL